MADEAPTTGRRSRAPRNPTPVVPPRDALDQMLDNARSLLAAAEQIDATALAIETMIERQRQVMRDAGASSFLCTGELWDGILVLLTVARGQAIAIAEAGEAIDKTGTRAIMLAAA